MDLMGTLWWACSMIFLLTFAVLQTVVYSDLGCWAIACLAIGWAVLLAPFIQTVSCGPSGLDHWPAVQTRLGVYKLFGV